MSRRLKLQVVEDNSVIVTHHFDFNVNEDNKLWLTIGDNRYILDARGKLLTDCNTLDQE